MKRILTLFILFSATVTAQTTFNLIEQFGVSWPDQIIEFGYSGNQASVSGYKMMLNNGTTNTEVPFQWVSKCMTVDCQVSGTASNGIVVRSSLPTGGNYTWTLTSGSPAATPSNPVVVTGPHNVTYGTTTISVYDVTNGLTGFRVLASQGTPWNLAPIQGVLLADGTTWTGYNAAASPNTPNFLWTEPSGSAGSVGGSLNTKAYTSTGYVATTVDSGPMKTTISATTTFSRPEYSYNGFSVTGATNASPIVVTVASNPPSNGQQVHISSVGGNTAANGIYYAKVLTSTTFALYSSYDGVSFSSPVAGNGTYTSSTGSGRNVINVAGTGHYTINLTLYANSKSVLVDEDSDMQMQYFLPTYTQLGADRSRFRGFGATNSTGFPNSSYNTNCGFETPLTINAGGMTNASPVVVSTTGMEVTGMVNGQTVTIVGTGGSVTNAYAKLTGYTQGSPGQQFALYTDTNLSSAVPYASWMANGGTVYPAYRGYSQGVQQDGFIPITYTSNKLSNVSNVCQSTGYRGLVINYMVNFNSQIENEMYNSAGTGTSPVVGFYAGRFSKQFLSATSGSVANLYSSSTDLVSGGVDSGIMVGNYVRSGSGTSSPLIHKNWGIYVTTQSEFGSVSSVPAIETEQNELTGIGLSHLAQYVTNYSDPPGGWFYFFMPASSVTQIKSWLANGTPVCGSSGCYYTLLKASADSTWEQPLVDMWKFEDSTHIDNVVTGASTQAQTVAFQMANGDLRWGSIGYYQFGFAANGASAVCDAVLMDSSATTGQKNSCKPLMALFGSTLWDNDFWPIDNTFVGSQYNLCAYNQCSSTVSGDSVGLLNQIDQYRQYRAQFALALNTHPLLSTKLSQALATQTSIFSSDFAATGAAGGSTHYQSTFFEPMAMTTYIAGAAGYSNLFNDPKWMKYSQWELSTATPPEPRFGNVRKMYSNGDGDTEAPYRAGMLATGLKSFYPSWAGNLSWFWNKSNSTSALTYDQQFVPTILATDVSITQITPNLTSLNLPGYHSNERHGFGTNYETSLWFINGGSNTTGGYSTGGHRHYDDGQVSIYADNAPLAIDWNANLYNPETPGRWAHNSIVVDSERTGNWYDDNTSLSDVSVLLGNPTQTEFESFLNSTHATATFLQADGVTTWTRSVRTMAFNQQYPVIYVKDTFSGTNASAAKTMTWNTMSTGAVTTPTSASVPGNSITPTIRLSTGCVGTTLPSNGTTYTLGSGLQGFSFTGQNWPAHLSHGISWYLYLNTPDTTTQFLIGNWGHGCHSTRETSEYSSANSASFAETQHILRVHDTGPFSTTILPYPQGSGYAPTVTTQSCGTQIVNSAETTCFNDATATWTDGTNTILTSYDGTSVTGGGVTISGGASEAKVTPGTIYWQISGNTAGTRTIVVPSGYKTVNSAVSQSGTTAAVSWTGGLQATPTVIVFSQFNNPAPAASPANWLQ